MSNLLPDRIKIDDNSYLKAVAIEDSEEFLEVIIQNQSHFSKYEFLSPAFSKLSEVKEVIESLVQYKNIQAGASYGLWHEDQLIGLVTINKINWDSQSADIGLWLVEKAIGKGIAYKALQALIQICWKSLNLKVLTAHTAFSNTQCQRLLEKLKFCNVKVLEKNIKVRGADVDEYLFQLVRPE